MLQATKQATDHANFAKTTSNNTSSVTAVREACLICDIDVAQPPQQHCSNTWQMHAIANELHELCLIYSACFDDAEQRPAPTASLRCVCEGWESVHLNTSGTPTNKTNTVHELLNA
jgi:hypothetical protein